MVAGDWNSSDGGCDVGFAQLLDDCSAQSYGSVDKRSELDVDAAVVVVAQKEFVAAAVEIGVSLEQILEEVAGTPEMLLLDDADERSSHLMKQKTWE